MNGPGVREMVNHPLAPIYLNQLKRGGEPEQVVMQRVIENQTAALLAPGGSCIEAVIRAAKELESRAQTPAS